jgi:hypothetical protein
LALNVVERQSRESVGEQIRTLIGEASWAALTAEERSYIWSLADGPEGRHYLDTVARALENGLDWIAFGWGEEFAVSIDLNAR